MKRDALRNHQTKSRKNYERHESYEDDYVVLENEAYVGEASSSSDQMATRNLGEQPPQAKYITRPKWDDAFWTIISLDYI
eukprot:12429047-Karenia_brevis.AAC.1